MPKSKPDATLVRDNGGKMRSIEDITDASAYRNTQIDRADATRNGAPLWHGWVIVDAYLAGLDDGRKTKGE